MKRLLVMLVAGMLALQGWAAESPNGLLTLKEQGGGYVLTYGGRRVIEIGSVGFGAGPRRSLSFVRQVTDDYQMVAGKRLHCHNEGREYATRLADDVRLVVRLYNDGLAFRYESSDKPSAQEQTCFRIAEGTRRWMQQWVDSYEGFFPLATTSQAKTNRWGYPALLEPADGLFALITEANIERGQSASCLYSEGDRFRVVPDQCESREAGAWHSPWRVVIVGGLGDIVESTLVTDVSESCRVADVDWIRPGVVSWIYWAYNHGSNDYAIIKKYVDMAVALHLPYVLIDAEWDQMKDGKSIDDAIAYARSQGIAPMIWYNSSVGWIDGAPTPKFRLNKAEDREREFAWCERLGVAGVKIDFFSGDTQKNMDYCIDLLESAARHHLLVNFHGATVPRGWQRTYPNLLSTEGVYGAEWYNNVPTFTDRAARHNATLPFTRNVIGPMDYTPCTFSDSQHPHITTHGHELALTVLYESGLQHLADRPESYLAQPAEVQRFFGQLPAAWDETRYVSGYPGESVVLARRKGNTWYVAGINGRDEAQTLRLALDKLPRLSGRVEIFADEGEHAWRISTAAELPQTVDCRPRGGFVCVVRPE